jgi:type II secretory pathway pseudopilin PulG
VPDEQPPRKRVDRNAVLIAVVALALVALLATMPAPPAAVNPAVTSRANATKNAFAMALEAYKVDFGAYPPDNVPGLNGSQVLHEHLCKPLPVGNTTYGPYMAAAGRTRQGSVPELFSPTGRRYTYKLVKNAATGQMDVQIDEETAGGK